MMAKSSLETSFAGAIPAIYQAQLVPMLFEPYAKDLVERLRRLAPRRVLELAAGTGVVTHAMARALPSTVSIMATDLNAAMLEQAARVGTPRNVEWRQVDAMRLPFDDGSFDAVVCQFGVMFFPDRSDAYAQVRRVLEPGGTFLFNTWDRIEENEIPHTVQRAVEHMFPDDPPRFLTDVPHGYFERERVARDLSLGGFATPMIDTVAKQSRAPSARFAATAFCHGTPLRNQIEARDASRLPDAVDIATSMLVERFGNDDIEGRIQAHVIQAGR